jgi:hypothetical protein
MMARLRSFGAFWYDFVVGDDWQVAVAVVLGLLLTWVLSRAGVPSWWVLAALVAVVLPWSLWRATRRR